MKRHKVERQVDGDVWYTWTSGFEPDIGTDHPDWWISRDRSALEADVKNNVYRCEVTYPYKVSPGVNGCMHRARTVKIVELVRRHA